jgi:hypothetical protein
MPLNYYQVKIFLKLYFKNIESIAASEGSYVSSEANFKQTGFKCSKEQRSNCWFRCWKVGSALKSGKAK